MNDAVEMCATPKVSLRDELSQVGQTLANTEVKLQEIIYVLSAKSRGLQNVKYTVEPECIMVQTIGVRWSANRIEDLVNELGALLY